MSRVTVSDARLVEMIEFWEGADPNTTPKTDIHSALTELLEWRWCALYDATMEGPKFKGWNRSGLDRLREAVEAESDN